MTHGHSLPLQHERKSKRYRHNYHIHFGKAEIVIFLEYLIGRSSRRYVATVPYLTDFFRKRIYRGCSYGIVVLTHPESADLIL
jgi:hypothetical protein